MLADVTQHIEEAQIAQPIEIVDAPSGGRTRLEVQHTLEDAALGLHIGFHFVPAEERTFVVATGRVTNETGAAAYQGQRPVPRALPMSEQHQRNQVAVRETRRRRIEAAVSDARRGGEMLVELDLRGPLIQQAAPAELGQEIEGGFRHGSSRVARRIASTRLSVTTQSIGWSCGSVGTSSTHWKS